MLSAIVTQSGKWSVDGNVPKLFLAAEAGTLSID
jgi:hypothetical protein